MKTQHILFLFWVASTALNLNCKKTNVTSGLPPATQEGKNTLGFLLNGEVWLPKGDNGYPNLICDYDETFMGGAFNITGYRYETNRRSFVSVTGSKITSAGMYKLNLTSEKRGDISIDQNSNYCVYEWYDTIPYHNAFLNIAKLDKQKRIISGTFEFSLKKSNCQEIRVTQGRFDMKY